MSTAETRAPVNEAAQTDAPAGLTFVDPSASGARYRVVLWAAPGEGKSVAAASAPGPVLVVSADRPNAYRFARRYHAETEIREVRFAGEQTLAEVYRYLKAEPDVETVILDPFHNIYDALVDRVPRRGDGEPDYQAVNKKLLGFVYSLRQFDVHAVLVAHEKVNDGKRGDGKLYPQLGGPTLTNKILAECDLVARVEREAAGEEGDAPLYVGQLDAGTRPIVCKQGTGALGPRREINLTEWFALEAAALEPLPQPDLPWDEDFDPDADPEDDELPDPARSSIGDLKVLVEAQRSVSSALKSEAEATR